MAAAGIPTASPEPSSSVDNTNVVSAAVTPPADVPEDAASTSPGTETTPRPEETEAPDAELTSGTESESGGTYIDTDALVAQIVAQLQAGEADYSDSLEAILLMQQKQEEQLEAILTSETRQENQFEADISILLWLLVIVVLYFIYRFWRIFF